jgi:WD40 repeat protein
LLPVGAHRQIELRSVADSKIVERIPTELLRLSSMNFTDNSSSLLMGGGVPGESGAVLLLSLKDKTIQQRFTNFTDLVTAASFNSDATRIAVASADSSAILLTRTKTNALIPLLGHSGPVLSIAWSPQNDIVVTASADRSLKVWSAADGTLLRSFSHHTEPVHGLVFRPGTDSDAPVECASASDDGTVRVWQPQIGRMVRIIRGHEGPVFSLAYTPGGKTLFSAGKEGIIRCLDTDSDQIRGQWKAHDEPIFRIAISPDGKHLASGDWSGKVHLWKISGDQLIRE